MKPSQNCLDFIKQEEGCILHSYQDQAGVWTIGIGSTMHIDGTKVGPGEIITMEQAMALLNFEVSNKAVAVYSKTRSCYYNLTQNQFDALVSFTYNVGVGALDTSTLRKKISVNPNDPLIRNEFMKWNKIHVNGQLVANEGLTERRGREADLYFKK